MTKLRGRNAQRAAMAWIPGDEMMGPSYSCLVDLVLVLSLVLPCVGYTAHRACQDDQL